MLFLVVWGESSGAEQPLFDQQHHKAGFESKRRCTLDSSSRGLFCDKRNGKKAKAAAACAVVSVQWDRGAVLVENQTNEHSAQIDIFVEMNIFWHVWSPLLTIAQISQQRASEPVSREILLRKKYTTVSLLPWQSPALRHSHSYK